MRCESLKEKLTCTPVLAYPKPFVLETDTSLKGLRAVLSQKQSNGQLHPVAYASRALSPEKKNYGVTELETSCGVGHETFKCLPVWSTKLWWLQITPL